MTKNISTPVNQTAISIPIGQIKSIPATELNELIKKIIVFIKKVDELSASDKDNIQKALEIAEWISKQIDLHAKSKDNRQKQKQGNDKSKKRPQPHPIQPKRGDVYMAELGINVGAEFNLLHPVLIIQNNAGNIFSEQTIVLPLTSEDENKSYDEKIHHKIDKKDFKKGGIKVASIVKIADIRTIDKARLTHKIGSLKKETMEEIEQKILNNLDIKRGNLTKGPVRGTFESNPEYD